MLEEKKYCIKKPLECSKLEIDKFHDFVVRGNKIKKTNLKNLRNRIINSELLGFCYLNDQIIGISAIKKPLKNYIINIIDSAKLDRDWGSLKFEIGYSYTEPNFRREGISSNLKYKLIDEMKNNYNILFSTTAILSSQKFLLENGFKNIGVMYDGEQDLNIKYFELKLDK